MEEQSDRYFFDADCFDFTLLLQFLKDVLSPLVKKKRSKFYPVILQTVRELQDINTVFSCSPLLLHLYNANVDELVVTNKDKTGTELRLWFEFDTVNFQINHIYIQLLEDCSIAECRASFSKSTMKANVYFYRPFEEHKFIYTNFKVFITNPEPPEKIIIYSPTIKK